MSGTPAQGYGVPAVRRPILDSKTAMANLISPLDVRCSMLDVRRFRADARFQTSDRWMKSFLKYWFPLLIWLVVIFAGSTSIMSADHTSRYIVPFLLWLKPGMSPHAIWIILITARKCAHVIEYTVLALLLWRALRSVPALHAKPLMVFCAVLLGCALFAASDEFHQMFVKSRTPSFRDVLLDVAGAFLGLLIGASFARTHSKKFRATTCTQFVDAQL